MKAVKIGKYGSLDAIQVIETDKPVPKKGEVLVKVKAVSVNSGDERLRSLNFSGLPMPGWLIKPIMRLMLGVTAPRKTPGGTLSGVVEEVGEGVTNFKPGDEIYAMSGFNFGALAELATLKASHCIALKPKKASFEEAAALPFGATTALHFLRKAELEKGKKVLIYGSTGAVGIAAVQVAANEGAEVTAICGQDGIEISKQLGAKQVYDYKKVRPNRLDDKFDIVFDTVGYTSKSECEVVMKEDAKYVSVIGFDSAKELSSDLEHIAELYDAGSFTHVIDSTFEFEDTRKAFERVSTGRKKGSVIVRVS